MSQPPSQRVEDFAARSGLTEAQVTEDEQHDDHDSDDVEDVHVRPRLFRLTIDLAPCKSDITST